MCVCWKVFILPLFLNDIFIGYRGLGWQSFYFQYFKYVATLCSSLHCFQWKFCHPYLWSSAYSIFYFSGFFKMFSLCHWILVIWLWCAFGVVLFMFLETGFHWASLIFAFIVFIQLGKLLAIISLLSFMDSSYINIWLLKSYHTVY